MRSLVFNALLVVATAAAAPGAWANDVSLVVENQKFGPGRRPVLILQVKKAVEAARIEITGSVRIKRNLGSAPKGGELRLTLPHEGVGKVTWKGRLDVTFQDESTGSMPLNFQTQQTRLFKFKVTSDHEEIRKGQKVVIVSEVPTSKIELAVYGDYGKLLANELKEFDNVAPGTPMEMTWLSRFEGEPLHLEIVVYDQHENYRSLKSFPYYIDIAHEDVEFESGKDEVRSVEEPKLLKAVEPINDAVKRYGKAVELDDQEIVLFVTGHTDTVGPSGSNRALSQRRAYAIARWLKKAGVTVPIYARGAGEGALKVQTDDEVDEPRNRRAEYQVLVSAPDERGGWSRVK